MNGRRPAKVLGSFVAATALLTMSVATAQAYNPTGGILYRLGDERPPAGVTGNAAPATP